MASPLDPTGPWLAGTMTSCPLYGITCAQTAYYYWTYPGDPIAMKVLVGTAFLLETAHLMLITSVSHFLYVHCKDPQYKAAAFVLQGDFAGSFTALLLLTSLVQGFYGWRVWTVSAHHRLRKPIVALIAALSFAQFVLGSADDVHLYFKWSLFAVYSPLLQGLYVSQLAVATCCDIVITVALVYFLNKSRSGFKSSEYVIDRLILYSVNVGLITSVISGLTFVTFFALKPSTIFTVFVQTIGKFYVNSMLVTLNSRKSIRKMYDTPDNMMWQGALSQIGGMKFTASELSGMTLHP